MSHDEDVRLVDKLRHDAETCLGRDECQVPLMYCAFGPADHCHEYAALWLRILARYDALLAEHEAVGPFVYRCTDDDKEVCEGHADSDGCEKCGMRMLIAAYDRVEEVLRREAG